MSKMFEQIKTWYDSGLWSVSRVHNAVLKGKITPAEFEQITGLPYGE